MVAGLRQRHTDDLGGRGLEVGAAALDLRQIGAPHVALARQQRTLARLELLVVVLAQAADPGQQRGVGRGGIEAQDADLAAGGSAGQIGLHMAQRQRQQVGLGGVGGGFDDAEGRAAELGQRRHGARGHFERKHAGVGQRAAAFVEQAGRQHHPKLHVLGQGWHELHRVDGGVGAAHLAARGDRLGGGRTRGRHQAHGIGQRARHRRVEAQHQRPQRQAGRARVLALAAEFGREARPHLPLKPLRLAGAPHQAHAGLGRKRPLAGQQQHVFGRRVAAALAQQLLARGAFDDRHRHALAQAFDLAPGRRRHARRVGYAVQVQPEVLVFLDARAGVGLHRQHDGRAGAEAEITRPRQRPAERREPGRRRELAALAGG